jgi:flavin reductase (DIM6/NTAB) family NADH-FMN oxidoreductase RutF
MEPFRIGTDPFALPPDERDVVRRFRGRLAYPVTVWTASRHDGHRAGLTVSSVLVVEGDPPSVIGLIAPLSDLWDGIAETKRFVVHVLSQDKRRLADDFAGRYPGPDAPFGDHDASDSQWGPVLAVAPPRVFCQLGGVMQAGYFNLVRGDIDTIEIEDEPLPPLIHYRGSYLTTHPRR